MGSCVYGYGAYGHMVMIIVYGNGDGHGHACGYGWNGWNGWNGTGGDGCHGYAYAYGYNYGVSYCYYYSLCGHGLVINLLLIRLWLCCYPCVHGYSCVFIVLVLGLVLLTI